jgi:hypothetical protein
MRKKRHLTIDEKRDWLAQIFRDASGDYSQADKFKALAEDTRLAQLQSEQEQGNTPRDAAHHQQALPPLLAELLPPAMNGPDRQS